MCDIHPPLGGYFGTDCIFCVAGRHRNRQNPPVTQFRCCDCAHDFKTEGALTQHLCAKSHRSKKPTKETKDDKSIEKVSCPECRKTFETRSSLQQHAKSHGHRTKEPKESQQATCTQCDRKFKNPSALKQHAESLIHKPLSNIKCLAHKECKKKFNCPSGQLQHLESGRCKSKMTKQILDEAIAKNDPSGIITSGGKTTQWSLEDASSSSSTPRSQSPTLTPTSSQFLDSYPPSGTSTPGFVPPGIPNLSTTLTLRPRSGAKLQTCPLCPSVKLRTYAPKALHDHLSSAVHQCSNALIAASYLPAPAITFHCPRGLAGAGDATKIKEFASVAGWRSISRAVPARGAKKR